MGDGGFADHVDGLLFEAEGALEPVDHLQRIAVAHAGDDGRGAVFRGVNHADYAATAFLVLA